MSENEMFDREVMDRAIRRLSILEYLILATAAVLALLGGALVAWIVSATVEVSFRTTWVVASLLLFVVPGAVVYARDRWTRTERTDVEADMKRRTGDLDG